jgi:hypothetical protein
MTEYERLHLDLLLLIAKGVEQQIALTHMQMSHTPLGHDPDPNLLKLSQRFLGWQNSLNEINSRVGKPSSVAGDGG